MAYLAPIHRPSGVRHALKLKFLSPDEDCLIVARANRLELFAQSEGNLVLKHTRTIYGKVTILESLHPANSSTDHLFIGTDRFMYFVVSWDALSGQLRTEKSYLDQTDQTGRDSMIQDQCLIDPTNQFMALHLYDGVVTILSMTGKGDKKGLMEDGPFEDPVPARIPNFFIRSSAFIHRNKRDQKPLMAFLYEDNRQKTCLSIRVLNSMAGGDGNPNDVDLDVVKHVRNDLESGASHLIPVPAPTCGLLILAEKSITYMSDSGRDLIQPLEEATGFLTWTQIDAQRWLLADEYGRLYFLMSVLNNRNAVIELKLDMIGTTSRASVLVYLGSGYVFVGSQQGDSQVILIGEGNFQDVDTMSSIAPILDLTLMDMGNRTGGGQANEYSSGQARIITGSGAFQDGSLRSLRSGVIMEVLASFEEMGISMASIKNLCPLRSKSSAKYDDLLIMSIIDSSKIFQFSPEGEVEELHEYKSLLLSEGTILAINLANDRMLHVCGISARIVDLESGMILSEWSPSYEGIITAASANLRYLAIAVMGVEAMILDLDDNLSVIAATTFATQIACIHVPMFSVDICVVGLWDSNDIFLLKLSSLQTIQRAGVGNDLVSTPRSIVLTHVLPGRPPTLLVAMANGEVVTFSVDIDDPKYSISKRKAVILGTQPATLSILPRGDGFYSVFAICEHPSLIYASEGRIVYSAVTAEKVSCLCSLNLEAFPGAIAIATAKDVGIASVGTERNTHVQTLHVQETVRRIAYSTKLKAFGLGTIGRTLQNGKEIVHSHFKLVDEVVFKELDTFHLDEDELVESVIKADLMDMKSVVERFIVGTSYLEDQSDEAKRGRILLFAVTEERRLRVTTTIDVLGACRALGVVAGRIVAGLVKTVVVYSLYQQTLKKEATYRCATAPIDLAIDGNLIAIADVMKSVSIIEYTVGVKGLPDSLKEVARHFQTAWATAVAFITKDSVLEADAEGNLMVLARNTSGVTPEDQRRLEMTCEIRLGEMVNRIQKFDVPITENAIVDPKAFLGTVEGSIYLFALILPPAQDLLMRLQEALAPLVASPGAVAFNAYRAVQTQVHRADEPFRFVDGELLDCFLDLDEDMQRDVVAQLPDGGGGIERVKGVVEALKRAR